MNPDFLIDKDEVGQRFTYPVSKSGEAYFQNHLGDFDLSEQGWELDTTETAYDEFLSATLAVYITVGNA